MKLISVMTPCYNEEENVEDIYSKVKEIFNGLEGYQYEHIFIDNCSKDKTVDILRKIAEEDKNVKIIINARNFGHIRSPYYALLQTKGDAVISLAADFQDPPDLIRDFIKKWEEGYKLVLAVKTESKEPGPIFFIRKIYYDLINNLSDKDVGLVKNFTGFGLYDRIIIDILKDIDDPYPYFRGLICDIGFEKAIIEFVQPERKKGITKNNFYTLYDMAMLGITSHSRVPLRIATFLGFGLSILSLLVALTYFIYKLVFWYNFNVGMAPLVIGLFFFSSVQLFFIGIIGEYIGSIHTRSLKRPLVIEKERINF
ncbi:MAG: dolichol monophosphate mannose synthase [Candidatus Melainabacteria bacterium GWF2_32_7]|nr:MAG: dolichol monophosphate mannose synthase [Candidatus Melainabacteria bacterium GWF2_32_7]